MGKAITLADIARKSKVSVATVSLVLRDKPGIPAETRKRVLGIAQALGYRRKPKPAKAAGLIPGQRKFGSCGMIIKSEPALTPQMNPFYSHVLTGIEEACRQRKVNLLYATLSVDENSLPVDIPHMLSGDHADGLLLVGAFLDETLFHVVGELSVPVVLVDAYTNYDRYDAVLSDNMGGARQAVSYLLRCGHRHIGLVGGHANAYPSLRERREGYLAAMREHGVAETIMADCSLEKYDVTAATRRLLTEHPEITALLGINDDVALQVMRTAQAAGRNVPGDLSVIGFDDIDLAQHVTPTLTTLHVDKIGMGRMAVQMLGNRLEFPDSELVVSILKPRLVERESVRRLAG